MASQAHDAVRQAVQERYSTIAETRGATTCCDGSPVVTLDEKAHQVGYSTEETQAVPDGANLGLGCGNPVAIASLRPGDVVVDLGSGAGFDCFLAAQAVGASGKVIGVDMTPAMLAKAREHARTGHVTNVEFRLGEIEHLRWQIRALMSSFRTALSICLRKRPRCFRKLIACSSLGDVWPSRM